MQAYLVQGLCYTRDTLELLQGNLIVGLIVISKTNALHTTYIQGTSLFTSTESCQNGKEFINLVQRVNRVYETKYCAYFSTELAYISARMVVRDSYRKRRLCHFELKCKLDQETTFTHKIIFLFLRLSNRKVISYRKIDLCRHC